MISHLPKCKVFTLRGRHPKTISRIQEILLHCPFSSSRSSNFISSCLRGLIYSLCREFDLEWLWGALNWIHATEVWIYCEISLSLCSRSKGKVFCRIYDAYSIWHDRVMEEVACNAPRWGPSLLPCCRLLKFMLEGVRVDTKTPTERDRRKGKHRLHGDPPSWLRSWKMGFDKLLILRGVD